MRTLLAMAIVLGAAFALNATADAARNKRNAKSSYEAQQDYRFRERLVCEERARHEDPTGEFAAFPCWAREAFGRGRRGGPGRSR